MISKVSKAYKPLSTSVIRNFSATHTPIAIIGGGCAGLNVTAQLIKAGVLRHQIRIFEPSRLNHYQPGWTLVGGGLDKPQNFVMLNEKAYPKGVNWTNLEVLKIDPENNSIETEDGKKYTYDQLVVAAGLNVNIDAVKGLNEALNDNDTPVATIYTLKSAQKWNRIRENFNGSRAVFTQAPQPIKCAGAPQKIAYLSHDSWVNKKKIHPNIDFYTALPVMFGQPDYSKQLFEIAKQKGINTHFEHNLVEVRGKDRVAVFQTAGQGNVEVNFDALHVCPPQGPRDFLKDNTSLVNSAGFVDVDQNTLQSTKFHNVWALGDCSSLPTSKTAAAITAQTPVLVHNLLRVRDNKHQERENLAGYYGYTSCPLLVGENKVLLAEFKYNQVKEETFGGPIQSGPSKFAYFLKTKVFPNAYRYLVPNGVWFGRTGVLKPIFRKATNENEALYQ